MFNTSSEIEEILINRFVVSQKRERYLSFINREKTRKKFIAQLYHFDEFDSRYVVELAPSLEYSQHIEKILCVKGAGEACFVVSTNSEIDRREMGLRAALDEIIGNGDGTILSCIPGKLAYFESEYRNRFILERTD